MSGTDDAGPAEGRQPLGEPAEGGHGPSAEVVRETLEEIVDPCSAATGSALDVVEMGLVKSVDVNGEHVSVEMRLTTPMCHQVPFFAKQVEERVGALPGVGTVAFETDGGFEWTEAMMAESAKEKRRAVLDEQETRYRSEATNR